ncbi:hypothetical protein MIDIC_230011 [Alphaproteobacteria bacterium]
MLRAQLRSINSTLFRLHHCAHSADLKMGLGITPAPMVELYEKIDKDHFPRRGYICCDC